MDDQLDICTLGGLTVLRNGTPIDNFDQRKVPALLVYLACAERPQPREMLAELFWEARTQSQSLSNLRVALSNLRKTIGPHVDVTRDTVGMCGNGNWRLDVAEFEERLVNSKNDPAHLEDALEFYQGDFLEGFYIDSQGFEDWLRLERERLRFRAIDALDRLIDCYLKQHNYMSGITQATRLLQLDSLREKTYRHLMELCALSSERTAALSYYQACCEMLETEFGVEPAAETVMLYDRIRTGELLPVETTTVPRTESEVVPDFAWQRPQHNLPAQPTSFVGREPEIAAIIDQFRDPDCRLLTLVGPGGIGKTRLALAVAEHMLDMFVHGAFFVPLAPLTASGDIVPAIATALQFQFYRSQDSAEQQLLNFLREKEMLLVLDNFEHLLDGVGIVDNIMTTAPGVTVLVTARQPLNLGWEWLCEVRGMLYPSSMATDHLEDYGAVQLFVERARRVQPSFRLVDERAHIIRICHFVEGMPLGIEIAAAWLRMMPCEAIADELLTLELPLRDKPERHYSLHALFDHTWRRLSPPEQDTLGKLSVFRGGFTHAAAEVVTQITTPRLAALVNKSLLQRDHASRRFTIHEMLRQYAFERLNTSGETQRYREQHADYYMKLLERAGKDLRSDNFPQALDALRADFDNLRVAWQHAVERVNTQSLGQAAESLRLFVSMTGMWLDGAILFEQAAEALEAKTQRAENDDIVLLELLARAAWCYAFGDKHEHRRAMVERGHELIRRFGPRPGMPFAVWMLWPEDYDIVTFEELLALFTEFQDQWGIGAALLELAHMTKANHEMDRATQLYAQSLAILEAYGDPAFTVWPRLYLFGLLSTQGKHHEAQPLLEKCLTVVENLNNSHQKCGVLNEMVLAAFWRNDILEAERRAIESYTLGRKIGSSRRIAASLYGIARARYLQQDYAGAVKALEEGLSLSDDGDFRVLFCWQLGFVHVCQEEFQSATAHFSEALHLVLELGEENAHYGRALADILVGVAALWIAQGKFDNALDCLAITVSRVSMSKYTQEESRLQAKLEAQLGPGVVATAIERAKDLNPFEVAREVLAELEQL